MNAVSFTSGNILIVDDVFNEVSLLIDHLLSEGYAVDHVETETEARNAMRRKRYDLAVVDAQLVPNTTLVLYRIACGLEEKDLPDSQGYALTTWMRENFPEVGIIMISGLLTDDPSQVFGLDSGADDYIVKNALDPKVLSSRIRAVIRRCRPWDTESYAMGRFSVQIKSQKLISEAGQIAYLTDAEFMALKLLFRKRNDVVSRDEIIDYAQLKHADGTKHRAADTLISKIRDKISGIGIEDPPIRTKRGKGYLLEQLPS